MLRNAQRHQVSCSVTELTLPLSNREPDFSPRTRPPYSGFFLVRLALPPLFFIGSAAYFLPHSYAKAAEKAGVPQQWRDLRGRVDHAANEVKKVSQEQSGKP